MYSQYILTYSPEGPVREVDRESGVPKLGEPFEFQLTFCASVYLFPSHDPVVTEVA